MHLALYGKPVQAVKHTAISSLRLRFGLLLCFLLRGQVCPFTADAVGVEEVQPWPEREEYYRQAGR